jgi:hypothetical protein
MIRPEHYQTGQQQPIEYMENSFTQEEYDGFCKGNIIKYVSRFRSKNGLEDLKKAQTYLQFLIDTYKEEELDKAEERILETLTPIVDKGKCKHTFKEMEVDPDTRICYKCGLKIFFPRR